MDFIHVVHVYATTMCDVRVKIEMESRCVEEDELDSECFLIPRAHLSSIIQHSPYDNELPVGCGYEYMKCNAIGHSQQPAKG